VAEQVSQAAGWLTGPADVADPGDAPSWFSDAMLARVESGSLDVEGTAIAFRAWGDPAAAGIVLVHGGGAHARWWDHVAPLLAADRRVVALDLSGHGDSGRRHGYTLELWASEALAVAAEANISGPPVIIGHSMGGFVALRAASLYGSRFQGAVAIESPVRDHTPEERAARERRAFGPLRVYSTREAALARFRPIPDQPVLPYVKEHIAATSIRAVDGGWSWKFDPRIFSRPQFTPTLLTRLGCRVALFRAEHGTMSRELAEVMYDRLGRLAPVIEIPTAGHHVMLDQPIAMVTGIRTLLSDWDHSLPAGSSNASSDL
jgi:pimeloyl-ACP methyl ester carboxylesterase